MREFTARHQSRPRSCRFKQIRARLLNESQATSLKLPRVVSSRANPALHASIHLRPLVTIHHIIRQCRFLPRRHPRQSISENRHLERREKHSKRQKKPEKPKRQETTNSPKSDAGWQLIQLPHTSNRSSRPATTVSWQSNEPKLKDRD